MQAAAIEAAAAAIEAAAAATRGSVAAIWTPMHCGNDGKDHSRSFMRTMLSYRHAR